MQVCMLCNRPLPERIDRLGAHFSDESWKVDRELYILLTVNIHTCQTIYMLSFASTFLFFFDIHWGWSVATISLSGITPGIEKITSRPYEVFRTDCGKHSSATGPSQKLSIAVDLLLLRDEWSIGHLRIWRFGCHGDASSAGSRRFGQGFDGHNESYHNYDRRVKQVVDL